MPRKLALLLLLTSVAASWGFASPIYSNGTPVGGGLTYDAFRVADDFVLASAANLDTITFWFGEGTTGAHTPSNFPGSVTWEVYNDNSGALGTGVAGSTVNSLTPTFYQQISNEDIFQVVLSIPSTALSSGTYWLEVHPGASLLDTPASGGDFWVFSNDSAGNAMQGDSISGGSTLADTIPQYDRNQELAFTLDGTVPAGVPEPATFGLAGFALLGLWFAARNRRKRG